MVGLSHHCLQAISDAQAFPFESHFFHDHQQQQQQRSRQRSRRNKSKYNRGANYAHQQSQVSGEAGEGARSAAEGEVKEEAASSSALKEPSEKGTAINEAETFTAPTVVGIQSLRSLRSSSDAVVSAREKDSEELSAAATERGEPTAPATTATIVQGSQVSDGSQRPKSAPVLRKVNSEQLVAPNLGTKSRSDVVDSATPATAATSPLHHHQQQQQQQQQPQDQQQHLPPQHPPAHEQSCEAPHSVSTPFEHEMRHIQIKPLLQRRPKSASTTHRLSSGGNKVNKTNKTGALGGGGGNRSYAEAQAAVRAISVAELCAWCACRFQANGYKVRMPRGDLSKSAIAGLPDGSAFCDWPCAKAWNAKYAPPLQRHARDVAIDFGAGYFVAIDRYKEECSPADRQVKAFGIEQRARAQRQAAKAAASAAATPQSFLQDPYLNIVYPQGDHQHRNISNGGGGTEAAPALPPRPDLSGLTALKRPVAATVNHGRTLRPASGTKRQIPKSNGL